MTKDKNKIKLLVLWDILCKNTDENHAMNSDEIREELAKRGISVMRKVVATDIAALNKYGYEVLSYKKKYYYYYVVSRPLETAEVVMLADVIKASKLTSTQKNIMIEKLSGTLCSHQAENLSKHIISLDKSRKGSSSLIYNVDAIERGIEENKQISFLYFDYDEKHKKVYRKNGDRYMVNPAFMVWNRDNYYMLCFSNGHDDMVTYRLDKMENVQVEEAEREPHPEYELFNTEEYRKQVFSMFGGETQKVTLLFTPKILSDMFDRFGDDIRIRKIDDNSLVVLKNNHLHTLLAYLEQIGYRKEITVFICDEIHDKVIDVFKTTAGGYSEAYKSIVVEKKRTATPNKYLNEAEELYFNYAKKYAAVLQSLLSGFNGNNEKEKIGYLIRHNATYGLGDIQWVKWLHNL